MNSNIKKMNPGIILQARVGSSRLPKKILVRIENKPMIWHVINRVKRVKGVKIVVATSNLQEDDVIKDIAEKNGIQCFRGSENDVLARFYNCALHLEIDPIIRITGDCPMIDPKIIDKLLKVYFSKKYDYVTNIFPPTFPDGLDIEIFSLKTLEKIYRLSKLSSEREHVTPYIRNHPKKFRIFNFLNDKDYSNLRWTVDEQADLKLIRKIYKHFSPNKIFGMNDILKLINKNPHLSKINADIQRNEGYYRSLKNDRLIKN